MALTKTNINASASAFTIKTSAEASFDLLSFDLVTGIVASIWLGALQLQTLSLALQRMLATLAPADLVAAAPGLAQRLIGVAALDNKTFVTSTSVLGNVATLAVTGLAAPQYIGIQMPHVEAGAITFAAGAGGGGGVTGNANAVVYINPAGTAGITDAGLTAAPTDPFGRPQLRDIRNLGVGLGAVYRQGAWQADGDPTSVPGEGLVLYGPSTLGVIDPTQGAYNRQKYDRMGLAQILVGVNGGNLYYYVRADPLGITTKDDSATPVTTSFLDRVLGMLFLGSGSAAVASNAGFQLSSLVANRAASRMNQFGSNTGVPGQVGFKSRGLTIGSLVKVAAGDTLWRATAIGVADDNASIGLAATIGFNVPVGGVPGGGNWVATDLVVELQPLAGPINGRKMSFKVDSEGIIYVKESANCMAGIAVLGAAGTLVVANNRITATSRIQLTVQDGGPAPTGSPYLSARVVGASFTVASTAGVGDAGVNVYYQIFEPTTP